MGYLTGRVLCLNRFRQKSPRIHLRMSASYRSLVLSFGENSRLRMSSLSNISCVAGRRIVAADGEPLNQARKHASNLVQARIKRFVLFFSKQMKVTPEQEKIVEFAGGAGRDIQKLTKLGSPRPSATFSNVCWNRGCGSSHLTGQTVLLRLWKGACRIIDSQHQGVALLPDFQLPEILHIATSTRPPVSIYLQLITKNCQSVGVGSAN